MNRPFQSIRNMPEVQDADEVEDRIFYQMDGIQNYES